MKFQNRQILRDRRQVGRWRDWAGGIRGANGNLGVLGGGDEYVLKLMVMLLAQCHEYTKSH
jgi:hypothetical protein